jgi:bacterioferritin (cytochrome b1)
MELSREEIRDIGIATAQHVLEGLHRYTVDYVPPSSIQQGLRDSMVEERTANDWYHRRSKMAAQLGDKTTADLYIHIAGEEEQHWKEFGTRLAAISGRAPLPIEKPKVEVKS